MKITFVYGLIVLLSGVCSAQTGQTLDCKNTPDLCNAKLQEWKNWGQAAAEKQNQLISDYDDVEKENERLRSENAQHMLGGGFLLGLGIGTVVLLVKISIRIKWTWKRISLSISTRRKQLFITLFVATWISVVGVGAGMDSTLSRRPSELIFAILIYSLPTILFGSIGLWWVTPSRDKKQELLLLVRPLTTALDEAIENCDWHNRDYDHITNRNKLQEWQKLTEQATRALKTESSTSNV